jgi:hypothetical protein
MVNYIKIIIINNNNNNNPGETAPGTHWIGGWVASRDDLGAMEKRTIFCPCQKSNSDSSVLHLIT